MTEEMIKVLEQAKITVFHIQSKHLNYSSEFDLADMREFDTYYTIGDLEFDKVDSIEIEEDIECIGYVFKYDDMELTISAIN